MRQEIHCHNCDQWVQFDIDETLNGNHIIECPICGHEHCRVIRFGEITGERWDSRNGGTFHVTVTSTSATSTYLNVWSTVGTGTNTATTTGNDQRDYLTQRWMNWTGTT